MNSKNVSFIVVISLVAFVLLTPVSSFADSDDIFTVIASTDKDVYDDTDIIIISGHLENFDSYYQDNVHFEVYSPFDRYSYFGILFPTTDGYFVIDIEKKRGWDDIGDYTLEFKYGTVRDTLTIKSTKNSLRSPSSS